MSFIFEDRVLPNGAHVLIPKIARPRTCRRSDGVPKITYHDRKAGRRARSSTTSCTAVRTATATIWRQIAGIARRRRIYVATVAAWCLSAVVHL